MIVKIKGEPIPMPFSYHMLLTCQFDDQKVEFQKKFDSPVQFQIGDLVSINNLDEGRVASVVWYLNDPGSAFLEIENQKCKGPASDWLCILEDMGYHSRPLERRVGVWRHLIRHLR